MTGGSNRARKSSTTKASTLRENSLLSVVQNEVTDHFRICHQCGRKVYYTTEEASRRAAKHDRPCRNCVARKPKTKRTTPTYKTKICTICKSPFKPRGGAKLRCIQCEPDLRASKRLYVYGLTHPQYEAMLLKQAAACAICSTAFSDTNKACVDHDHHTNKVRGLLCHTCNKALGMLGDTYERVYRATRYLFHAESEG